MAVLGYPGPMTLSTAALSAETAEIVANDPSVRAIARWSDLDGNEYVWPSALVDNRPTRTFARIVRFGITEASQILDLEIEYIR